MTRVNGANSNVYFDSGIGQVAGNVDKTNSHELNELLDLLSAGRESGQAYKALSLLEQGNFARTNLLKQGSRPDLDNAVGGVAQVSANSSPEQLLKNPRVRAMLDVLGYAEGTGNNYGRVVYGRVLGPSDKNAPYNHSLVGKNNVVVNDFSRHPNLAVHWANGQPPSSAAGRYQFLYGTYKGLNMPDFSPHSQDLAAIKLMQKRGMIEPLLRGDFAAAIHKGAPEWASLPTAKGGSYYGGQGAKSFSSLQNIFSNALKRYQGNNPPPTAPTTPTTPTNSTIGDLHKGSRGQAVETLQNSLVKLGLMTEQQKQTGPGIFGQHTENGVKDFQDFQGLKQTGNLDTPTQKAMQSIFAGNIKKGARGEQVRALQKELVRLGYMTQAQVNTGPGVFGPRTDAALRRFQKDHGLSADGVFGKNTFRAMQNAKPSTPDKPNTPNQPKPPGTDNSAPAENSNHSYKPWNVYSTGKSPARLADGYEDLQAHHDYQSVNYVMRGLKLDHPLEARDVVLTRKGESNLGQQVPSPITGKVLFAGNEGDGYGNKVVIKNEQTGQVVLIGHLQSLNVKKGATVSYGQSVGGQGSTGNSTGAHIHINADPSVIKRWVADLADGKFDGVRSRYDVGKRP